ncbi:MAG: autotransporter outer membrane beta-barrel domain-containing protein, partial [Rhodospirillales bacterium]|nr:autotransporter outer membrane beta-barrel domain-containing protein [Rhodospirillales bacterium]
RTVAGQAMDAVTARLEAGGGGNHVTLGGQQVSLDTPQGRADAAAGADAVARALGADTPGDTWDRDRWMRGEDPEASSRTMTGRELLLGSSFHLSEGGEAGGPAFAAWGRVAQGSFDAEEDGVRLDGAVTTGFLGADVASGRWLAGAAVAVSEGKGTFGLSGDAAAEPAFGEGTVESSLTSVLPYARYAVSERVSVWGLAGYGTGTLTLTAKGAEEEKRYRTDLSMALGAVGARGALLTPEAADGFALALKGDAFFVRTESDATAGMAAAQGDASRLRLALDGSRAFDMGGGATLTPSLELGVRHDGGDAETGFGADIGGGLAYSGHGLTAALHGRGLLSHEAGGMRERGFSGSLAWDPRPDSDRGMSLSLTQTVGASASGGADALLGRETMAGLAANDNGEAEPGSRLVADLGYGFAVLDGRGVATPQVGWSRDGENETLRLGQRLTLGSSEWALESELGEESRVFSSRYDYRPGEFLDLSVQARRREAAAGGAPEYELMLRLGMHW